MWSWKEWSRSASLTTDEIAAAKTGVRKMLDARAFEHPDQSLVLRLPRCAESSTLSPSRSMSMVGFAWRRRALRKTSYGNSSLTRLFAYHYTP